MRYISYRQSWLILLRLEEWREAVLFKDLIASFDGILIWAGKKVLVQPPDANRLQAVVGELNQVLRNVIRHPYYCKTPGLVAKTLRPQ